MKILLLGEYSGVHTNLATALRKHGYDVRLIHNGDGYKSFKADDFIKYKYISSKKYFISKVINIYYIILMYSGFKGFLQIIEHIKLIKSMKNYDVVQLINPLFLSDYGTVVNFLVFKYIKNNNRKVFLSALGDDYFYVKYCLNKKFKYSFFDTLNLKTAKQYSYPLHYIYGFLNPALNKHVVNNVNAVIPGLYDYYLAYSHLQKCTEIVPIIIESEPELQISSVNFPIKIFHGWQTGKDSRKGNKVFDLALKKLKEKYSEKIEYRIVGGIPYSEYIKTFNDSHIFIDQCYSQDRGVNALLGMSKGKVVFSGFEKEVRDYYDIDYSPIVNATPDADKIYNDLEFLVLNPSSIVEYSEKAITFIEGFHNSSYVLKKYLKIWSTY